MNEISKHYRDYQLRNETEDWFLRKEELGKRFMRRWLKKRIESRNFQSPQQGQYNLAAAR